MTELQRSLGGFFVQEDLDSDYYLLTCTGTGDITRPRGDEEPVYCPSPSEVGKFVITDAIEGEAGFATYSLVKPLIDTNNYLITELGDCRWHGRVNWRVKGAVPDVFDNYLVGLFLYNSRVTSNTLNQPVIISPDENDRVNTNADVNAFDWEVVYQQMATRITQTEPSAINGVAFDMSSACETEEIGGQEIGKDGYFTSDTPAGSAALTGEVYYTTDYGVTWTGCTADPFAAAESPGAVVTRGGRVIVARLTADAGNPAEVAYSDGYGATWTNVDVGAVDNQVINEMWWQDWTHLWACTTGGYVYFSDDGGETWTAQTSGGVTAQDLNDICAYDQEYVWAVGDSGALIYTEDGATWAAATGPSGISDAFLTCFVINSDPGRVLIGSDAGYVYRTNDGGATTANWTTLGTPYWSGGEVRKIRGELKYRYFIDIIGNTSGTVGQLYRSENGGQRFKRVTDFPTNSGLNDLEMLDHNVGWTGGEPQGALAFLAKIHSVG